MEKLKEEDVTEGRNGTAKSTGSSVTGGEEREQNATNEK